MEAPKRPRGHPNPTQETAQEGSTGCLRSSHPNSGALCCSHTAISSSLPFPLAPGRQGTHLGLRQQGSRQTHQLPLAHRQTLSPLSQLAVQSTCRGQAQQSHHQALHRVPNSFPSLGLSQKPSISQSCSSPGTGNQSLYAWMEATCSTEMPHSPRTRGWLTSQALLYHPLGPGLINKILPPNPSSASPLPLTLMECH